NRGRNFPEGKSSNRGRFRRKIFEQGNKPSNRRNLRAGEEIFLKEYLRTREEIFEPVKIFKQGKKFFQRKIFEQGKKSSKRGKSSNRGINLPTGENLLNRGRNSSSL